MIGVHPMLAPRFVDGQPTRERATMIFDSVARALEAKYGRVFRLVEELEGRSGNASNLAFGISKCARPKRLAQYISVKGLC